MAQDTNPAPKKSYPQFYEKAVPVAIGILVFIIIVVFIYTIAVGIGVVSG